MRLDRATKVVLGGAAALLGVMVVFSKYLGDKAQKDDQVYFPPSTAGLPAALSQGAAASKLSLVGQVTGAPSGGKLPITIVGAGTPDTATQPVPTGLGLDVSIQIPTSAVTAIMRAGKAVT